MPRAFCPWPRDIGLAPGRAYEVGCASGEMLNQFRQRGLAGRRLRPLALRRCPGQDDLRHRPPIWAARKTPLPRQQDLDLILVCHVLEHLYDPPRRPAPFPCARWRPAVIWCWKCPAPRRPKLLPPGWFTFEHLHYYQPAILERLLRDAGFELVEIAHRDEVPNIIR